MKYYEMEEPVPQEDFEKLSNKEQNALLIAAMKVRIELLDDMVEMFNKKMININDEIDNWKQKIYELEKQQE